MKKVNSIIIAVLGLLLLNSANADIQKSTEFNFYNYYGIQVTNFTIDSPIAQYSQFL